MMLFRHAIFVSQSGQSSAGLQNSFTNQKLGDLLSIALWNRSYTLVTKTNTRSLTDEPVLVCTLIIAYTHQ